MSIRERQVSAVHEAVGLPLLTGAGDMTDEFLTANGVRVAHQGHLPLAGAVKGMYDTLKALRDGVAPRDLRGSVATSEFMGQVTRKPDYDHWIQEYMN